MNGMGSVEVVAKLPIPLTGSEIEKYAEEGARLMSDLDDQEEEYKGVQAEWRAKIKGIKHDMRRYLKGFHEKAENREVECIQFFDTDKKVTWFEYNGDSFLERAMTDDEIAKASQGALFDDGSNYQDAANS